MKNQNHASFTGRTSETTQSCTSGTGRELLTGVLQRNPLVALGAAFLSPILGLFKARRGGTEIERLKLETYHARPCGQSAPTRRTQKRDRNQIEARTKPDGWSSHPKNRVVRASSSQVSALAGKGGN
jgi:hypothetical protein